MIIEIKNLRELPFGVYRLYTGNVANSVGEYTQKYAEPDFIYVYINNQNITFIYFPLGD